ncbi:MAG: glycosyltransferase family 4 protein [Imperialibacter sp.]|uniref:glycosyltransferase family 4 protein n=1 Tax=Imperialibacter sp. TaxID=2038411 RepID=UPI0032EEF78F
MVRLIHPGVQHSLRLADQLFAEGLLKKLYTTLSFGKKSLAYSLFPAKLKSKLSNRVSGVVPDSLFKTYPLLEAKALWEYRSGGKSQDVYYKRNRRFQEKVIADFKESDHSPIIGFDTSSWLLADYAKAKSISFILDQSIADAVKKNRVYQQIQNQYPDWAEDLLQKRDLYLDVEKRELKLATKIVVASTFTKESLVEEGVDATKIVINPYGVDLEGFRPLDKPKKMKFIFLGTVNGRKGTPTLINAWKRAGLHEHAELHFVGPISTFVKNKLDCPGVTYLGRLNHEQIKKMLGTYHVLVFPSFFEGFGQVILEALAAGLYILATDRTAAPDIISGNLTAGQILEAGNEGEWASALVNCYNNISHINATISDRRALSGKFTWEAYGKRWADMIRSIDNNATEI